jgi:hypothetical protein
MVTFIPIEIVTMSIIFNDNTIFSLFCQENI